MRGAVFSMCALLLASLALCGLSVRLHTEFIEEMDALCAGAVEMLRSGDGDGASDAARDMLASIEERRAGMELVALHTDIHDAHACVQDALVALECGDADDAYQSLVKLRGTLDHLRQHEALTLANIL